MTSYRKNEPYMCLLSSHHLSDLFSNSHFSETLPGHCELTSILHLKSQGLQITAKIFKIGSLLKLINTSKIIHRSIFLEVFQKKCDFEINCVGTVDILLVYMLSHDKCFCSALLMRFDVLASDSMLVR